MNVLKKKHRQYKGFIFLYKEEYDINYNYALEKKNKFRVIKTNALTKESFIFESAETASLEEKVHSMTIRKWCKENKLRQNFIWSYEKLWAA